MNATLGLYRILICGFCGETVPSMDVRPATLLSRAAWSELRGLHQVACEWCAAIDAERKLEPTAQLRASLHAEAP